MNEETAKVQSVEYIQCNSFLLVMFVSLIKHKCKALS